MQLLLYRLQKKNHDAMVNSIKEFYDMIGKMDDLLPIEIFQLDDFGTPMESIINIANTVPANHEEEVWVTLSYRDRKHMDEYTEKCKNNKSMDGL